SQFTGSSHSNAAVLWALPCFFYTDFTGTHNDIYHSAGQRQNIEGSQMASVTLRNVSKAYGDNLISKNVNLDIAEGEFVVFVGPSGCGKSTLLRCIAGLEDITSGDLYIGEQRMNDIPPAQRGVGMVFQSYALYPHLNLFDNMSFGMK